MNRRKVIGLIIGIAILIITAVLPAPEGLSVAGKNALGLLLAAIALWVTEALPLAISAMLLMILLPIYGVTPDLGQVFKDFMSPVIFFVIATFAIAIIIMNTPLAIRITDRILSWAGDDSRKLVFGFIAAAAILSMIMENVPACALFMALGLTVLERTTGAEPGKSNLGKCLMIAIPFGAMIGGAGTPAGTSINLLAMYLIEEAADIHITFFNWMVMAIPMIIIMVPVCWLTLVNIFKPEPISKQDLKSIQDEVTEVGPMSTQEKKVIWIVSIMVVLWVASTWIPALDIYTVAIAGLVVMFLPGIDVLTWEEFVDGVSWNIVMLIGGAQAIAAGLLNNGAADWMVNTALAGAAEWGATLTSLASSSLMALLHALIPVGPAIAGMATPPIASLATIAGASAVALTVMVAMMSAIAFILPIDVVPLVTYGEGHYTMLEYMKAGIIPTIALILYCTFLLPPIAALIGL